MTNQETLELALEVLKSATPKYTRQRKDQKTLGGALDYWKLEQHQRLKAIKALEEALAVKQEQRNITKDEHDVLMKALAKSGKVVDAGSLAKQEQSEPVAMRYDFDGYGYKYIDSGSGSDWQTRIKDAEPVYTTPQQRTWVGLTNDECVEIAARGYPRWLEFAQAIEAKLKEKNSIAPQGGDK